MNMQLATMIINLLVSVVAIVEGMARNRNIEESELDALNTKLEGIRKEQLRRAEELGEEDDA